MIVQDLHRVAKGHQADEKEAILINTLLYVLDLPKQGIICSASYLPRAEQWHLACILEYRSALASAGEPLP